MRWILVTFLLLGCIETDDVPETRCSGNVIEYLDDDGTWQVEIDCEQYLVAHSQTVCSRVCCETDDGAFCLLECP
jgi:hypothetical protein